MVAVDCEVASTLPMSSAVQGRLILPGIREEISGGEKWCGWLLAANQGSGSYKGRRADDGSDAGQPVDDEEDRADPRAP